MLTLMKWETRRAERVGAQGAAFCVVRAERSSAVVAESLCGTATGYAQLILQPSSLDNSADKIVHTRLGARSSTRNDELTLDLARRIESQVISQLHSRHSKTKYRVPLTSLTSSGGRLSW